MSDCSPSGPKRGAKVCGLSSNQYIVGGVAKEIMLPDSSGICYIVVLL